ncbi:hypothetical protein C0Q70_15496 [Pomacea canaliculata]|uniref:Uncharacterized protein n=1 Tax=Pomacea canaliculata TaxID=400727 RepID=A0A2T7NUZ5_POMCA|nr:hypothetical protein C0Q70_15496 [Pomacea canaliculata]
MAVVKGRQGREERDWGGDFEEKRKGRQTDGEQSRMWEGIVTWSPSLHVDLQMATCLAHEDCLVAKGEELDKCTKAAVNLTIAEDTLDGLVDTCRRVHQVAVCLDSVIEECQATSDPIEINILRNTTLQWRRTFDSLCNSILDLQTEHLFAPSQGSSSQPLVILIVAAAVVTNVFSPASWSSALFSSQGLPIGC